MAAFVLGNGVSREPVSVDQLLGLGAVYGCNGLYRTSKVTALVATDAPISREIQQSNYALSNRFYTRRPMPNLGALPIPKKYFGFSSGPIATAIAAQDYHSPIYLLGFDMGPELTGRFNNIYAGTEYYKQPGSNPTFTGNWSRQMATIFKDHQSHVFVRVFGATTREIPEFSEIRNLTNISISDFLDRINTKKDL